MSEGTFKEYVGKETIIRYSSEICTHSGVCTCNLASVFDMKKRPWIDPDGATYDEIKALIDQCPSGALQCEKK